MSSIKKIIPQEVSDKDLLDGIASSDGDTLLYVYKTHYPSIEHMILTNSGSTDQAKDIFQEAMMVLYDKVTTQGFTLESKLKTFLYAVSRRLWLKSLHKKENQHVSMDNDSFENLTETDSDIQTFEEREQQFDHMEQALRLLGEPCKGILSDFYLKNKNMQEITEKYGYTNTDNAKTQKYKCLQRLKKLYFSK